MDNLTLFMFMTKIKYVSADVSVYCLPGDQRAIVDPAPPPAFHEAMETSCPALLIEICFIYYIYNLIW